MSYFRTGFAASPSFRCSLLNIPISYHHVLPPPSEQAELLAVLPHSSTPITFSLYSPSSPNSLFTIAFMPHSVIHPHFLLLILSGSYAARMLSGTRDGSPSSSHVATHDGSVGPFLAHSKPSTLPRTLGKFFRYPCKCKCKDRWQVVIVIIDVPEGHLSHLYLLYRPLSPIDTAYILGISFAQSNTTPLLYLAVPHNTRLRKSCLTD